MQKPKIVIADDDFSYIVPLQSKFIYEFFDDIELEVITDEQYYKEMFSSPQKIDILIVDKKFYLDDFDKHEIKTIFVMTEDQNDDMECGENVHLLYKYTNVKGILIEIVGKSGLKMPVQKNKNTPQIIMVTSASGGIGKTTVAMGIATALSEMYKKVLYIEASRLQTFQYHLKNAEPILKQDIYTRLDYNNDDEEAAQWKSQNIQIELGKDDILSYCSDEDNMSLFDNYTDYIYNDVMDWSTLDIAFLSAGTVLYKGVEMTVDDLLAILSKEGYSEKQIRAQFDSIIASVISANQNVSLTVKEWKIAQDTVEELCKDYLNDKNKNSAFKSFVEMIGGIDAIKELNKTAPQLIDYLFSDYSNGFKIIESLKEDCNTGSEMYKAISELESKYRSKWLGVIGSVTDYNETMIAKIVDNDIKKWLKKECGQYSVITSFLEGTNLETKTDAAHALVAQRKIHEELKHKYEILFNKFNSGNYDDGDVEAFKNVFNLLKENTKEMYKTCLSAKAGDVSTQIKINQEISKIDNLEITRIPQSYAETGVLTYEG